VAATPKWVMEVTMAGTEGSAALTEAVLGVDTHLDLHVAVALDQLGRRLGALTVPTTAMGYKSLVSWAEGFGPVRCAGVEGPAAMAPCSPATSRPPGYQ
jgi:hypothetical protein